MAAFLAGLGIALFLLTVQWYVEKKTEDAETLTRKHQCGHQLRATRRHGISTAASYRAHLNGGFQWLLR